MNHLKGQKSPYLLQHADNPVDWYPWGEEAFAKARAEDKPVFLSIGYSTCHWCHVMEHESFDNPRIAGLMNDVFVSIKVDREERPDLDEHFMAVCQMLTGQRRVAPHHRPDAGSRGLLRRNLHPGRIGVRADGHDRARAQDRGAVEEPRGELVQSAAAIGAEVAKAQGSVNPGSCGRTGAQRARCGTVPFADVRR